MLSRSLWLRLLVAAIATSVVVCTAPISAFAQDDDDEEEEGGEEGGEEGEEEEEEGGKLDKDQPPVTAGGLYTLDTYPLQEVIRPLTITKGMFEGRLALGFDVSKGSAFKIFDLDLDVRYGVADHVELQFGGFFTLLSPQEVALARQITLAAEMALKYDLVDFRVGADLNFNEGADFSMGIFMGFPVKYRLDPKKIAIVALDRVFTINTVGDPDLTIGVGGVFQVIDPLALIVRAQLNVIGFNPDFITIPVELDAQFSPSNRFDLGLGFRLGNLKAPEGGSPIDQRTLLLFLRARL
jgi:hypothetical protein